MIIDVMDTLLLWFKIQKSFLIEIVIIIDEPSLSLRIDYIVMSFICDAEHTLCQIK
jgi:hypothetical protein